MYRKIRCDEKILKSFWFWGEQSKALVSITREANCWKSKFLQRLRIVYEQKTLSVAKLMERGRESQWVHTHSMLYKYEVTLIRCKK